MAARSLGYDVHVLDPDPNCAASAIASRTVAARFDDADAAASLARACAVVTLEIEQIGTRGARGGRGSRAAAPERERRVTSCRTASAQKQWLADARLPRRAVSRGVIARDESVAAFEALGRCIFKSTSGGYDGRGQVRVATADDAAAAWGRSAARPCLVEQFLDLDARALDARGASPCGHRLAEPETVVFPPALNHHERGILAWSVLPATRPGASSPGAPTRSRAASRDALGSRGSSPSSCSCCATASCSSTSSRRGRTTRFTPPSAAAPRASSSSWCARCATFRSAAPKSCAPRRSRICSAICGTTATRTSPRRSRCRGRGCTSTARRGAAGPQDGPPLGRRSRPPTRHWLACSGRETQCGGSDSPSRCVLSPAR